MFEFAMSKQKVFDDSFGNFLLHGIEEVYLPESIAWWPETTAWKVVGLLLLLGLGRLMYRAIRRWQQDRYRRLALTRLEQIEIAYADQPSALKDLPGLLKATALRAYPRSEVAQASGAHWLRLLDEKHAGTDFKGRLGQQLLAIAYQQPQRWQIDQGDGQQLLKMSRRWISGHLRVQWADTHV